MPVSHATPLVRKREGGVQLSYQLPHRVYDVKAYPKRAPNGSSIILYAHDTGIRVIWRGGRTFKSHPDRAQVYEARQRKAQRQRRKQELEAQKAQKAKSPFMSMSPASNAILLMDEAVRAGREADAANEEGDIIEYAPQSTTTSTASTQDSGPIHVTPTFNELEEEIDPSEPYENILREFDIRTGVKVLKISLPTFVPEEEYLLPLDTCPPIISSMIVLAAICADSTVRVFALPLAPPVPELFSGEEIGLQCLSIPDAAVQNIPAGVALTFTSHSAVVDADDSESEVRGGERSSSRNNTGGGGGGGGSNSARSRSRGPPSVRSAGDGDQQMTDSASVPASVTGRSARGSDEEEGEAWDVLLAVHTTQFGGLLTIYRIPIIPPLRSAEGQFFQFAETAVAQIHKQYLFNPVKTIAFSPKPYPKAQHGRLLVAHADKVKIFQCLTPQPAILHPANNTPATSSNNPTSATTTSERASTFTNNSSYHGGGNLTNGKEPDFIDEGKWLVTLHLSQSHPPTRKIIDAKWVFGGKGIMVLLTDGSWGIWCIERLNASGSGLGSGSGTAQKVSLSEFTLSGRVAAGGDIATTTTTTTATAGNKRTVEEGSSSPNEKRQQRQQQQQQQQQHSSPGFTPMTPATRKVLEGTLFQSGNTSQIQETPKKNEKDDDEIQGKDDNPSAPSSLSHPLPSSSSSSSSTSSYPPRTHGGIAVYSLPNMKSDVPDEEILLWHGGKTSRIPDLLTLLNNHTANTIIPINDLHSQKPHSHQYQHPHQHQHQTGIGLLPATSLRRAIDPDASAEIVITTEYELMILPGRIEDDSEEKARREREEREEEVRRRDQERLARGELDLMGINRVLAGMQSQSQRERQQRLGMGVFA